jgi:hypothetical protein
MAQRCRHVSTKTLLSHEKEKENKSICILITVCENIKKKKLRDDFGALQHGELNHTKQGFNKFKNVIESKYFVPCAHLHQS